jgi:autotransporter translocation and assembly factor TamB
MKMRGVTALLLLVLSFAAGALTWLFGTNDGARWVMERLFKASPVAVRAERISGSLANTLSLEGLRVESPDWEIDIRKISLSWQPRYLLLGNVVLKEVSLQEIIFTDKQTKIKQPLDLTWPQVPKVLFWFKGHISEVRIDGLKHRTENGHHIPADTLRTALDWRFGTLKIGNLSAQSPLGSLEGFITVGLSRPSLIGALNISLKKTLAAQDRFSISARLLPVDKPEQIAGHIVFTTASRDQERFRMEGRLGIGSDRFILQEIVLQEKGRPGTVVATGEVLVSQPDPYARLRLEAKAIDLSTSFHFPALLSGTVDLSGNMNEYKGAFNLKQHGAAPSWLKMQAAGTFAGNGSQTAIRNLNGRFLEGTFKGNIALSWEKGCRLSWNLDAVNMNPASLKAELPGNVNFNTAGFLHRVGTNPPEGNLKLKLIDSVFQQRTLSGMLDAQWKQKTLKFARCELHGHGLDFRIGGMPEKGLTYRFSISESSQLLPMKGGPFTGSGTSRYEKGEWAGTIDSHFAPLFSRAHASWIWNARGLNIRSEIHPEKGGVMKGSFTSLQPPALKVPEEGTIEVAWNSLDLEMLQQQIPASVGLKGRFDGAVQGRLLKNARFQMSVKTGVSHGHLSWKGNQGITSLTVEKAYADLFWENSTIRGRLHLQLTGHGRMEGTYEIPLPARFPLKINPQGSLNIRADGELHERGLLSVLFPGVIRESRGVMTFQLSALGTWQNPECEAKATVSDASAQLPVTGIRLENGKAEAILHGDHIRISSFRFQSGEGEIHGSADVRMKDRQVDRFEGRLKGERFQAVYLPEIRISVNPDLQFAGTLKEAAIKGNLAVHQALIQPSEREGMVKPSADVVIVDRREPEKMSPVFVLKTRTSVSLGESFIVRAAGVDARLDGKVLVVSGDFDEPSLEGRIAIAKGHYDRYGVKLNIHRGHLAFTGGPAESGQLDILAYRTVRDNLQGEDVHAGVTITGPLRAPIIKLYSRPVMSDGDILGYIVLGRPVKMGEEKDRQDLLFKAAGALLTGSASSGSLQRQIQERLSIDTIELESATVGGVSHSLATVGKYLSPNLYIAFGRSLFTSDHYLLARYRFLKNWHIESKMGIQTGADLFYRVEFD